MGAKRIGVECQPQGILADAEDLDAACSISTGQRGLGVTELQVPIQNTTLKNGLRVVIAPDATAPVVTVGVYYKIGFRLEPPGRSGFAHLFEHMMVSRVRECAEDAAHKIDQFERRGTERIDDVRRDELLRSGAFERARTGVVA